MVWSSYFWLGALMTRVTGLSTTPWSMAQNHLSPQENKCDLDFPRRATGYSPAESVWSVSGTIRQLELANNTPLQLILFKRAQGLRRRRREEWGYHEVTHWSAGKLFLGWIFAPNSAASSYWVTERVGSRLFCCPLYWRRRSHTKSGTINKLRVEWRKKWPKF